MSAEAQAAVDTPAPADEGPREIFVVGQEVPKADEKVDEPAKAAAPAAKAVGSEEVVEEETGKSKTNFQTRIDEVTRARRAAEREAEYWKARAQAGDTASAPAAKKADTEAPVRTDFETDEAFLDALADHKVEQKLAKRDQERQTVTAQETKAQAWQSKLEQARADIEGFDALMESADTPVAAHVAELIMEHDHGPKVMHHYAQNPAELEKLNAMSPAKVAFEIGKLSAKFEAASATSSEPAAKATVSKAPPPAARSVGSGRSTETALGDLPMDDYIAKRKQQGARWSR